MYKSPYRHQEILGDRWWGITGRGIYEKDEKLLKESLGPEYFKDLTEEEKIKFAFSDQMRFKWRSPFKDISEEELFKLCLSIEDIDWMDVLKKILLMSESEVKTILTLSELSK
jgi:hypothetical protein